VTAIPLIVFKREKYIEASGKLFEFDGFFISVFSGLTISPEDIVDLGLCVALVVRVRGSLSSLFPMYLPGKPVEAEDIVDLGRFELVVSLIVAILLTIPVEAEDILDLEVLELVVALLVGLDFGVTFPLSLGRTVAVLLCLTSFVGATYLINLSRLL
jgi:hypothetical protein